MTFENPSVIFEFCTNIFNYPPYFSQSVGKLTRSEMHLMHRPLEFAQSVGDFVGNIIHRQLTDGLYSVGKVVGDCGISSDYFWTLCEMSTDKIPLVLPTDNIPSVYASVSVAFQVIIFELSVKCRRTVVRQYGRR